MTAKQKKAKVENNVKGHNFVLNHSRYIISSITGFFIILLATIFGYLINGGRFFDLIHIGPIFIVLGITLGGLVFSYRSSAFRPWLVSLGLDIPQEELIIKKYIQICNSAIIYGICSGILAFIMGIINTMAYLSDTNMAAMLIAASFSAIAFSLGTLTLIVIPTKFKLENLLNDKNIYEAEKREKKRRLEILYKKGKEFHEENKKISFLGIIKIVKLWIYNSPTPALKLVILFIPIMILGFLLLGILIDSLTTTNKWNNPDGGGVWISKKSNFKEDFKNGNLYIKCNDTKIHVNINNSIVRSWARGDDIFSISDQNLEKLENTYDVVEGEWFTSSDGGPDHYGHIIHLYIKDNFWVEIMEEESSGKFESIKGGIYNYLELKDFPYEFQTKFHSNEEELLFEINSNNNRDNQSYKHYEHGELVNIYGGNLGRDIIYHQEMDTENEIFELQKIAFNLEDNNKLAIIKLSIEFSVQKYFDIDKINEFKRKELINLNSIIYDNFTSTPKLSFNNYGHVDLINKFNRLFNEKRFSTSQYKSMYPINPVKNIIPHIVLITDPGNNSNVLPAIDFGEYSSINFVNKSKFIPGKYALIIDESKTRFEISKDGSFEINSKNFISDKNISGTWWINGRLIIFEGTQEGGGDTFQLEFNKLNRQLIKVIRNGENILFNDNLESVYLIYDEYYNTHLLPYSFNDPILVNIKGEDGIVLSTKISLLIECVDNEDSGGLQADLDQHKDYLIDICRSYLASIHQNDLTFELVHKDELRKRINMGLNEILENSIDLSNILMLNPIQKVLFKSYTYQ